MKRGIFSLILSFLFSSALLAQTDRPPERIISIQPLLWLDNLVPTELVGVSAQYEHVVAIDRALVSRVLWFKDPLFTSSPFSSAGYAVSVEYRFYLSEQARGWHLAPFAELARYKFTGILRSSYGPSMRTVVDFGVIAGYKWVEDRLSFDISVRTAWYSPATYPAGKFFPTGRHQLNSHMLISLGYGI